MAQTKTVYLGYGALVWVAGYVIVSSAIALGNKRSDEEMIARHMEVAHGQRVAVTCAACHQLGNGENGIGPSLMNVLGRPAGQYPGYEYSEAMKNSGIVWTSDRLRQFLRGPQKMVPGTRMGLSGLSGEDADAIVNYLEKRNAPH